MIFGIVMIFGIFMILRTKIESVVWTWVRGIFNTSFTAKFITAKFIVYTHTVVAVGCHFMDEDLNMVWHEHLLLDWERYNFSCLQHHERILQRIKKHYTSLQLLPRLFLLPWRWH